jgi:hypothetical protein
MDFSEPTNNEKDMPYDIKNFTVDSHPMTPLMKLSEMGWPFARHRKSRL